MVNNINNYLLLFIMNLEIINNYQKDFFTLDNIHYFNNQHREIIDKLHYFVINNQIPNIIFYGGNSCGKKYILKYFLNLIYKNNKNIEDNILCINCCHGKGNIKFIREELKLFANSIIINNTESNIKSVILLNADYLTIDAQSSLRRLIEVNNKTTRFFIVVNNYEKLLKPIISRFCSIYFNQPTINNKFSSFSNIIYKDIDTTNMTLLKRLLNKYNFTKKNDINLEEESEIKTDVVKNEKEDDNYRNIKILEISENLYNKGYSSLDILKYIESIKSDDNIDKYRIITLFEYLVKEFRNEKILIYFLLNYVYFRFNYNIKKFL